MIWPQDLTSRCPASFPGSLFSASVVVEKKTLVRASHVSPRIWEVHKMCVRGGVAMWALSTSRRRKSASNWFCSQMIIDKTFDGSILCITHIEFDVKGKKSWSNRSDATENILALFKFSSMWRGPHQRRMLIVCDNFKEKKILSCKKTSETFIHGKQTCSAISPLWCYLSSFVTCRPQIIKSNCIKVVLNWVSKAISELLWFIRSTSSLDIFKIRLKTFLFNRAFN